MKIVFLDTKTLGKDINLDNFNTLGEVVKYETTEPNETLARVQNCDVVVTNKVLIPKEIIEQSKFKLICITATGTNNIDLEAAQKANIAVKNVSDYSTSSVSQLTFTLVLELIQKISYYKEYVDSLQWSKSNLFTHIDKPFFELKNKKWGIIGLGNIGKEVAKIATAFGCEVNYYSTSGKNLNTDYNSITLEELLKTSDVISIHSPLNDSTYNLINKTNLDLLKEDTILVNVGRGGIINEEDLAKKLDSSKSLYCGLDVVEKEPIEEENPLLKIKNKDRLILTPHIAWASIEARTTLINKVFDNIKSFVL
ncbi:D-2-hydroxyacid dehydrogenase [Halarcobacter bivalviorum]|uniref:Hydroxyacid dehydrogenase n=1 Tax=Halarcobacter bivalviorum TaxID=663364 RepID=A0AAX2A650_9BACT|nr:D-2-hydroxyacid dehydrogenase [Halarcobacter bivalviorum]AXH11095.1 2-hydroxyacid dehydrogenase [Halarcobacter bivalviorum]RXK09717.1 hydroxyacid dehydrogenase [Halarcobacter bivalviorum]